MACLSGGESRRWTVSELIERFKNLGVCASRASVTAALAELGLELELSGWAPWRLLQPNLDAGARGQEQTGGSRPGTGGPPSPVSSVVCRWSVATLSMCSQGPNSSQGLLDFRHNPILGRSRARHIIQSIFRPAARRERLGKHPKGDRRDGGLKMGWTKPSGCGVAYGY